MQAHTLTNLPLSLALTQVCLLWEERRRAGDDANAHPPHLQKQTVPDTNQTLDGYHSPVGTKDLKHAANCEEEELFLSWNHRRTLTGFNY